MSNWRFGGRIESMIHEWEYYYSQIDDNDLTSIKKDSMVIYNNSPLEIKWNYINEIDEQRKFKIERGHYWYPVDGVKNARLNYVEDIECEKYMCLRTGDGLINGKEYKDEYIIQVVEIYYKYLAMLEFITLDILNKFEHTDLRYGEPTFGELGGAIPPEVRKWAYKFGYTPDVSVQSLGLYDENGEEARDGWPMLNKWRPSVCIDMRI